MRCAEKEKEKYAWVNSAVHRSELGSFHVYPKQIYTKETLSKCF